MLSYYTAIIILVWMVLAVLCILVRENGWIPKADKWLFYMTYSLIAISALAEWCGVQLNGNTSVPRWLLSAVKCMDYILTPLAGGALVWQMKTRNQGHYVLLGGLAVNTIYQIIASFNNWMIVIDAHNHYVHGMFYGVYIAIYLWVILVIIAEFLIYGKSFRRQNRFSLYAIITLIIAGIALQEILGSEYRTAYIALTMGAALMFIHYAEFYQMSTDDHIRQQDTQIMQDALTGAYSRHAYSSALKAYDAMEQIPGAMAAFAIDINGLKAANDMLGHDAGDELIIGAAHCIEAVFGERGKCFRTGGDEFVVLGEMSREQAEEAMRGLERETKRWTGEKVKELSLSTGYALAGDYPELSIEKLVRQADQKMYAAKAEYYRVSGYDRRGWYRMDVD